MTVTYTHDVANARLTGFSKLLLRWKGSIYKLLYREIGIFVTLYYTLSFIYRYILSESQQIVFEKIALYCEKFTNMVPLTFVLGFYVSIVVTRWWQQFMQIPWPDKLVMLIVGNIHGSDERGRLIRRTLARYLLLLMTLTCQAVSTSVRRRFPTLDHVEEAGIMTKEERIVFDEVPGTHGKYWVPTVWFTNLIIRAKKEGRIKDDILLQQMLDELHVYRKCCGMMFAYDWISIPLVYTQTVTIATYTYFLANVMGRQYLDPSKGYSNHEIDLYVPVFTIFEFFFFMGWLKVAEQLINPFGEDDDDFELNWCLDRNLLVSFWIVDEMYSKHPRLVKDMYWDEDEPKLPYTKSSFEARTQPYLGSAVNLSIEPEEAEFVPMETIMEEDNDNQPYDSPPASPGIDLISIDGEHDRKAKDPDDVSQSRLNFFADTFRGSRFFGGNKMGSTENVTSPRADKSAQPLIQPFMLRTPKKQRRTLAVNDTLKMTPTASSPMIVDNEMDVNRNSLNNNPGVLQTSPVIPSRNQTRQGTPVSRRSLMLGDSVKSSMSDIVADSGRVPHYPGLDGFKFPMSFSPKSQHQSMKSLTPSTQAANDEIVDIEGDLKTPVVEIRRRTSSVTFKPDVKNADDTKSIASTKEVTIAAASEVTDGKDEPQTPIVEDAESPDVDPYEPTLSSDESFTPFNSNQSTVTSLAELLRHDKKSTSTTK